MFVFIFQFLDYQQGDENIVIENTNITTSIFNQPINHNRRVIYQTNILGQKIQNNNKAPRVLIYDDGSYEKKIIVD